MKLCIPFRLARLSFASDVAGNKSASALFVPKLSEQPHDITAALWGRYVPSGELVLHNVDPNMLLDMEPGAHCNVLVEVL
jgi:hypothetical protein